MTIPNAPKLPDPKTTVTVPSYYEASVVLEMNKQWLAHSEALVNEIERLRAAQAPTKPPVPAPSTSRFPGDPGSGKAIFGVAPGQDSRESLVALEKEVGGPLAFRQYHGGSADFAVPNGYLAKAIMADHKAGRVPVISPKPGIEQMAAHYDPLRTIIVKFLKWLEAQPGITYVILHHEGENDWKSDFFDLVKYKKHQADYRAAQQWFRALMNEAIGPKPKKVGFIGSLLSYSWSKQGREKFGDPEGWNPGKQADGTHVWDVACLDHYQPSYTGTTLETQQWIDAAKSIQNWGCLLGITENGVNHGNKSGGIVLSKFISRFVEYYKGVIYLYFSSSAGPGGKIQPNEDDHWTLTEANGSLPAFIAAYKRYNFNPMAKKV